MPVILNEDEIEEWFNSDTDDDIVNSMMKPYYWGMFAYTVSSYVNNPRNKSEECIK